MSFGDGNLHAQVAQLKTENARLKQRNGELRALVRDIWREMATCPDYSDSPCMTESICQQVRELMEVSK